MTWALFITRIIEKVLKPAGMLRYQENIEWMHSKYFYPVTKFEIIGIAAKDKLLLKIRAAKLKNVTYLVY